MGVDGHGTVPGRVRGQGESAIGQGENHPSMANGEEVEMILSHLEGECDLLRSDVDEVDAEQTPIVVGGEKRLDSPSFEPGHGPEG